MNDDNGVAMIPERMLDWQPLFEDHGIPLAIMGLCVVFAALVLVRVFIGLLPRIIAILDHFYPDPSAQSDSAPKPKVVPYVMPEQIPVVIAAAVALALKVPHRIVRTRELSQEELSWSLEGRRQHHASHRIHPRDRR